MADGMEEMERDGRQEAEKAKEDYIPAGYESVDDFLKEAREEFSADEAFDRSNREAALDDLKFVGMDQWDPEVRAQRERMGRPCLSINVLPQFIGQVIGDRRINKTSIAVQPRKDATEKQAETRSGIIKSIEAYSRAERTYDMACEDQVTCGIGWFRIAMDYADNDVFEQDIFIRPGPNPLAVVWDRMHVDVTGRDARHCFVQDSMPRTVYEKMWPDHPSPSEIGDSMTATIMATGWMDKDIVRVTEWWRMIDRQRKLALFIDGSVQDVTDMKPEEYADKLYQDPKTGEPRVRMATRMFAQMHLITGFCILEGPYELPLTRLPIIKVTGREIRVGDDRVRFGLVRFAKDPQRLKNYWRSTVAETLAMAPKAQWIAPQDAVEGLEDDFRESHLSGDPLLVYKKGASQRPERVAPPPLPAALVNEAQMNAQDIKDTTGLQDASLGIRSNEISGRAIKARQGEGDVATIIYHDNLNASIQEGGDVVNQLIPIAYDTVRTVRVIGADDKQQLMEINNADNPNSIDITSGKYDVTVVTGPSYTTQRQEAAASMMQAIQVAPQLMQIAGDLIVKAQDWPGSQEIADRLKRGIPPQLTQDPNEPPPPEAQQAAAQAQQAQQVQAQQLAEMQKHAEGLRGVELATHQAKMVQAQADASAAQSRAQGEESKAAHAEVEARAATLRHAQSFDHAERGAQDRSIAVTNGPTGNAPGSRPVADRSNKGKRK